jgi:hypothetical protein
MTLSLLYLITSFNNPLYSGKFGLGDRFRTYGQHSFIYDFAAESHRQGLRLHIAMDNASTFPLTAPLNRYAKILDLSAGDKIQWADYDATLADVGADFKATALLGAPPVITVVHNPYQEFADGLLERSTRVMALNSYTRDELSGRLPAHKLFVNWQGVDLERFRPAPMPKQTRPGPKVLVYSRIDAEKRDAVTATIDSLAADPALDITVLGDGAGFWSISDKWGHRLTLINYIPCHSIHRFVPGYDVVVSSGRGVMEAMACAVPAIAVGRSFLGAVTPENVLELRGVNFSGYAGSNRPTDRIGETVRSCAGYGRDDLRRCAEKYFGVRGFVERLLKEIENAGDSRSKPPLDLGDT